MCGHEKNNLHDKRVCGSRTEAFFCNLASVKHVNRK